MVERSMLRMTKNNNRLLTTQTDTNDYQHQNNDKKQQLELRQRLQQDQCQQSLFDYVLLLTYYNKNKVLICNLCNRPSFDLQKLQDTHPETKGFFKIWHITTKAIITKMIN